MATWKILFASLMPVLVLFSVPSLASQDELEAHAKKGDAEAQYQLAVSLTSSPSWGNCNDAVTWLTQAGNQGHAHAQQYLSSILKNGCIHGEIPRNVPDAYYWVLLAQKTQSLYPALPGHLTSQKASDDFGLPEAVRAFEQALPVDQVNAIKSRVEAWKPQTAAAAAFHAMAQNIKRASAAPTADSLETTRTAAEGGDVKAQFLLGYSYEYGRGVPQDPTQSMKWYSMAAEKGYTAAELSIANMYEMGIGLKQDYSSALSWYRKAADQGDTFAQADVARIYEKGQGIPQNLEEAYFWYSLAEKGGRRLAPGTADKYADSFHLTGEQKAAVKKRVDEWKPAPASQL